MNRSMAARLVALLVVAVLGVYYIAFDAVGIHLWGGPYKISVVLPAAGGIYQDASVTYRGVEVGKVSAVNLRPHDVLVDLAINKGTKIPTNAKASVKELTAAAEQYMDLVPAGPDASSLKAGAVIDTDTSVPVTVGTLLNSLNTLVNSVHAADLNTISTAFAQGLANAGPDLRSIIVNGRTLLQALVDETQPTATIITSGNTVLNTFNQTAPDLQTFASGLNQISQQFQQSNSDLQALLHNGTTAAAALNQLLTDTQSGTVNFIDGLSATVGLANARQGAVQATFALLPVVAQDLAETVQGGTAHFELAFNTKNTVCPYTSSMLAPTTLVAAADLGRTCDTTAPDLLQRGASSAPTPGGSP